MGKLKILAVDDDPVTRKLLKIRLEKEGYQVKTAENGTEAVNLISKSFYEVVLTDLMMPGGVDGIGVLKETKEKWIQTEVILMTAFATVETAVKAMKVGATDYLKKPIDFDELLIRLEKIVTLKSLVRDAGDLREAMNITEKNATQTIQDLEIMVFELKDSQSRVMKILTDPSMEINERVRNALLALSSQTSNPPPLAKAI